MSRLASNRLSGLVEVTPSVTVVAASANGPGVDPRLDRRLVVGTDPTDGQQPQTCVPAGTWQRTLPVAAVTLVSCVVSPGFDFADFELDEPEGWAHDKGVAPTMRTP